MTPNWLGLVLLGLAAYRTWRLIAEDTIAEPVRQRLIRREKVSELVSCPWCLGLYVSLVMYAFWLWQPEWTLAVSVPLAISAFVGTLATVLNKLSE